MILSLAALGRALGDADHHVHEEGGVNAGAWIRKFAANVEPPINVAAPWCAMWCQYVTDHIARLLRVANPLDAVKLEALVASYHAWATTTNKLVTEPRGGDLVCFNFNGQRWDHIGFVVRVIDAVTIETVEGNTSAGVGETSAEKQREGDGVYVKTRVVTRQPTAFIRWD